MNPRTELNLVTTIPYSASYLNDGRPGATDELYLHPDAHTRLIRAQQILEESSTSDEAFGLLVFDGYRAPATQASLFHDYVQSLMDIEGITYGAALERAAVFVRNPASVYPHGTGGVVDLTLTINGQEAWLGTCFDEFTDPASRDWFDRFEPTTPLEQQAAANRRVLFAVMSKVGFVGLAEEWWHFEWGTQLWAAANGELPILTNSVMPTPFDAHVR